MVASNAARLHHVENSLSQNSTAAERPLRNSDCHDLGVRVRGYARRAERRINNESQFPKKTAPDPIRAPPPAVTDITLFSVCSVQRQSSSVIRCKPLPLPLPLPFQSLLTTYTTMFSRRPAT
jgi:hypothetical protein